MRQIAIPIGTTLLVVLAATGMASAAQSGTHSQTYTLRSSQSTRTLDRVEMKFEVGGDLTVVADNKVERLKMSVVAHLVYHEKPLEVPTGDDQVLRSVRWHDVASAVINIEDSAFEPALSEDRRLIGVEIDGATTTLFSPHGPLTREELDLIDLQANSLLLERLLPGKPVAVGETWSHCDALVAAMLRLDGIKKTDVHSKLSSVKDNVALMEMAGTVEGAIHGVATSIEIKGKYQFHLRTGRVTGFGLLIKENRSIGHVGTGLDVVARLQTTVTPGATCERLTDAALAGLPLRPTPELLRLVYRPAEGGWQLQHDRRWFITAESAGHLTMRMIDRGELVAQCNLAVLDKIEAEKLVSLDGFQKDIQRALGKNFEQFVQAAQRANEAGYRVYRVVAQGEVEKLPIIWIYHLVADRSGHRLSLAFTMEGELFEQFGEADQAMVATLRFMDSPPAS